MLVSLFNKFADLKVITRDRSFKYLINQCRNFLMNLVPDVFLLQNSSLTLENFCWIQNMTKIALKAVSVNMTDLFKVYN